MDEWLATCPGFTAVTAWVDVDGGQIRTVTFAGAGVSGAPLVFVPGWCSSIRTWQAALETWASQHPVCWVETREKPSATVADPESAGAAEACADFLAVLRGLPVAPRAVVGMSTGVVPVLGALTEHVLPAETPTVLMTPHVSMPVPQSVTWIQRVSSDPVDRVGRAITPALWRRYRAKPDPALHDVLVAIDHHGVHRLAQSALAWGEYRFDDAAAPPVGPRLVVAVAGDSFHDEAQARHICTRIGGDWLQAGEFDGIHGPRTAHAVANWVTQAYVQQEASR